MGAEERVFVSCLVTHGQAASREARGLNSGLIAPAKQRVLSNHHAGSPLPYFLPSWPQPYSPAGFSPGLAQSALRQEAFPE